MPESLVAKLIYRTDNCDVCYLLLGAQRCKTRHSVFVAELHGHCPYMFWCTSTLQLAVRIILLSFLISNLLKKQDKFWHEKIDISSMTMKIFPLFFVLTFCSGFNVDSFLGTVVGVKQYYRSGCVYLLYSEQIGEPHYVFISTIYQDKFVNLNFTNWTFII